MRWSFTLGSFKGTAVRIHITFLMFLAWIGFAAYQRGGWNAARDSLAFIIGIFSCVVLHEFGHILTARRYGIVAPSVTLLPIGGVADVSRMPDKPCQELLISLAGPAVNVVIAGILIVGLGAADLAQAIHVDDPGVGLLARLAVTNLFIAAFNMIPAFPMDGGRVLRAALAMWIGQEKATRIAATIGQLFAFMLGFLGLFGNPLLIFIAFFVYFAAAGEAQMTLVSEATRGVTAADVMETRVIALDRATSVGEAVETLLRTAQDDFPVVDATGRLQGLLSRDDIIEAVKNSERGAPIAPFVNKTLETIEAATPLDKALAKLNECPAVGVLNEDGALAGLVTRQSIAEVMLIKSARPDWKFAKR